jgi:hypothetical protein
MCPGCLIIKAPLDLKRRLSRTFLVVVLAVASPDFSEVVSRGSDERQSKRIVAAFCHNMLLERAIMALALDRFPLLRRRHAVNGAFMVLCFAANVRNDSCMHVAAAPPRTVALLFVMQCTFFRDCLYGWLCKGLSGTDISFHVCPLWCACPGTGVVMHADDFCFVSLQVA